MNKYPSKQKLLAHLDTSQRYMLRQLLVNEITPLTASQQSILAKLEAALQVYDERLKRLLKPILHHAKFLALEGRWRGLHYLVKSNRQSPAVRLKVLTTHKVELRHDFDHCHDICQSYLYRVLYEEEFSHPGGQPYNAVLIDDYFSHKDEDVSLLKSLSQVAEAAFCPIITGASPKLLDLDSWAELTEVHALQTIFQLRDYAKWRQLRAADSARFLNLVLPRILARKPYLGSDGCWMNASYALVANIMRAFKKTGWPTALRGCDSGGKVSDLVTGVEAFGPTEVAISDNRELALCQAGLISLCHYKSTDYAVFFATHSLHNPANYSDAQDAANARIAANLPYLLATSRFAHLLKIMARDKIGSYMSQQEVEIWLNRWLMNYVNANAATKRHLKAKYPLQSASIEVIEDTRQPGTFHAKAWLQPWLQLEQLSTAMKLVTTIPKKR